ncbi:MAG TPA: glycosyltransferase family 2 protein [Candidatus Acidoferrum sp.]|nr:glycosyltransferase family 2 protein [Candidatus Acidoferrum sp.]
MPLFSIIITSHNQPDFIRDAVNSALAQAYEDKEIIVVDDASNDESPKILELYGNAIRLIQLKKNVGASGARNFGIEAATGDFLVFLDGDDLLLPWALDVYREIVEQQQPQIILSTMLWFRAQVPDFNRERPPQEIKVVAYGSLIEKDRPYRASASALVIRREVFTGVHGWTNEIFPMEDLDVLIKLLHSGRTAQILSPATVAYRMHGGNTIHQVANCAGALRAIMEKEKRGSYPHGGTRRGDRYAFLGGPALFWIKRAYQSGLYREAMRLVLCGWPMIIAAGARRAGVSLHGRRPTQTLALPITSCRL